MSVQSVNLLRERVIRAAIECVEELEKGAVVHTKGSRALVRAVTALRAETWRIDEAPSLVRELIHIIELQPESSSILGAKIARGEQETVLRAKAFLGQREVNDDTAPKPPAAKRGKLGRRT